MKLNTLFLSLIAGLCVTFPAYALNTLVGLTSDGRVVQIDTTTGALTDIVQQEITNFSLGAIARKKDTLYYVAAPSGTNEYSIFIANLKTPLLIPYDLDRNDEVRALFLNGKKVQGIFYDGTAGTVGIYRIDPISGVTTLITDLSALSVEPVGGTVVRSNDSFYALVKPNIDSTRRQLLRFSLKGTKPTVVDIKAADGSAVLCDRIQATADGKGLVCVASPSTTQVTVCKLTFKGIATCGTTLTSLERVAGGHTLVTANKKIFYVLGYAPGDQNSQRLVSFNKSGVVKSTITIPAIITGLRFAAEDDGSAPTVAPR